MMRSKVARLLLIGPLAILGMALFIFLGGEIVKLLWNWLGPTLFDLPRVTFWQALGLLALCRILFGGWSGGRYSGGPRSRIRERIERRMKLRMDERTAGMTPEERDELHRRLRERWPGCGTSSPDPSA